ncbi:hypothetical protein SteCoe_36790 [Stentor coeruleus]|uniref:Uncharacterized protein n=1 Tax=Stentor coeruleus TaxID=5963 RepID=A0A1R2APQ6_9CILI|nr:hypothetical protein SteCoe_36790 [Stentor coeruleus]
MEIQANRVGPSIALCRNPHKRQFSDTTATYSYNSLIPSNSEKYLNLNLKLDSVQIEPSNCLSVSSSPQSTLREKQKDIHKPISLIIIEKYFSDICQSIANKDIIEKPLLSKAATIQDVLKDCLTAVPDISLQFYVLMASALKEIQQIYITQDNNLYSALAKKLVQIAEMIEENTYISEIDRINTQPAEEICEIKGLDNLAKELLVRVNRVTARILNIWKKILSPQREAAVISCSFLLFYCEVDPTIKVSPTARIPADKAVDVMRSYINNPGHVVTIIRKTREYVDKEMISVETARRINDLLEKITVEQVKNMDKTLTGFVIYDLVYFSIKYFEAYAKEHYKINVFEKVQSEEQTKIQEIRSPQELTQSEIEIKNSISYVESGSPKKTQTKTPEKPLQVGNRLIEKKTPPPQQSPPKPRSKIPISVSSRISLTPKISADSLTPKRSLDTKTKTNLSNSPSKKNLSNSPSKSNLSNSPSKSNLSITPSKKNMKTPNYNIFSSPVKYDNKGFSGGFTTRVRSSQGSRISAPSPTANKKDFLEEMQYQQFVDEKFRHFLIDKLKQETEKLLGKGFDIRDIKVVNEASSNRNRIMWVDEFENYYGPVKGNAAKNIYDEKKFNAEVIKAQRQLDIILKFGGS